MKAINTAAALQTDEPNTVLAIRNQTISKTRAEHPDRKKTTEIVGIALSLFIINQQYIQNMASRRARLKTGIMKQLHHSFATYLLENGYVSSFSMNDL